MTELMTEAIACHVKKYEIPKDWQTKGYDLLLTIPIGFCIHTCSECKGTQEVTGHKYWCSRNKEQEAKDG